MCKRTNGLPFRVTQMNRETQEDGERRKGDVHVKQMADLEAVRTFFTVRLKAMWNALPDEAKEQQTVNDFTMVSNRLPLRMTTGATTTSS